MGRGYRPLNGRCTQLATLLESTRGTDRTALVVRSRPIHYFEHAALLRFG